MQLRHATAVALGMTTLCAIGGALAARALFTRQAAIARGRIGKPLGETSIQADRVWRQKFGGTPLQLLLLGDSLAAGLGAEHRKETLGGRLAKGIGRALERPVQLRTAAVVGSESQVLGEQLDQLPGDYRADIAVIVIGGNDVTHLISPDQAVPHLRRAIRRLRAEGTAVVVGTCPDLGALRPVPQPLRAVLSQLSSRMARAQAEAARDGGAIAVDLRQAVGPVFREEPTEMFSIDRFHPSAAGYRRTADALLPAALSALRVPDWR